MAQPMCMTEGHGPATFIGTFFPSGDNVRLCDECMPNFCAAVFERMTGVDMAPAILMASEEGAEIREQMSKAPQEVAYPPDMAERGQSDADPTPAGADRSGELTSAEGAPTSEPPPVAPADLDPQATQDPTSVGTPTDGEPVPVSSSSSSEHEAEADPPPEVTSPELVGGE